MRVPSAASIARVERALQVAPGVPVYRLASIARVSEATCYQAARALRERGVQVPDGRRRDDDSTRREILSMLRRGISLRRSAEMLGISWRRAARLSRDENGEQNA